MKEFDWIKPQPVKESGAELAGQIIGSLFILAIYLAVPVIIFAACIKVLFF